MSYLADQRGKTLRRIKRLQSMTKAEYNKLRPDELMTDRRIVEFMKEHKIVPTR